MEVLVQEGSENIKSIPDSKFFLMVYISLSCSALVNQNEFKKETKASQTASHLKVTLCHTASFGLQVAGEQ